MASEALAIYGLTVPPNEGPIPASTVNFPARLPPQGQSPSVHRSTLKLIRVPASDSDDEDSDEDDDEDEYLKALINASDDDEDSDEDEPNGGPSDQSKKSKKQKRAEALASLIRAAQEEADEDEESDEEMADAKTNGVKSKKGKEKATDEDEEDEEDSEEDDELFIPEEFVICTLDTERLYQQPIDITVREDEEVYFIATGTHAVTLVGNYIESLNEDSDDYDSEDEDDLDDDDLLMAGESDEESDELDDVDGPKGKNKRQAEEEIEGLDAMISSATKDKKAKKLKNNKGEAIAAEEKKKEAKGDKKVQFAKQLEQGPTGSAGKEKAAEKPAAKSIRVVQGVTIDDRKVGTGRGAKNGDTIGMRYIGKLQNGKQFDANKKGKPFTFKLGKGEVIKGWDVGVLGMAIGGERRLTIPANMAYGNKPLDGIPANSTLIFDVKLLEIK
ncbi:unnamed protein product [Parascedosporium putredinis]|uniref:FK506-binding protein n=1 Tax=Parascedosporium putredinis TaxID=1442378 RepID=A0A9P1H1A0_9PEZI|nr:unnamed protein product [Parascedosporium putredinis]CAI7992876.1 unnamed protein product [Parascedosporium putredinis]